jgi:hypothetical protein
MNYDYSIARNWSAVPTSVDQFNKYSTEGRPLCTAILQSIKRLHSIQTH